MTLSAAEALRPRRNWQAIVTVAILLIVGFLVVLPMVFLIEESLNVGDPMAFPPEAYGLKNYFAIFEEDINVLWNTLIILVIQVPIMIALATLLAVAEHGGFATFQNSVFNLRYGLAAEALAEP